MYNNEFECKRCGNICEVEGEYPRFSCWCDVCDREAWGFDVLEYGSDYLADAIDAEVERRR